jgi:hypothetical protein
VGFSYPDIFGYLLDADRGYITHWEFPDSERGHDYGSIVEKEYYEHRQDFLVNIMANYRYWFTPEQVEAGYRGLCRERKRQSKNEEARQICRRVRKRIHRLSYLPNLDNKIVRDLRNTIHLLDEMYERI